MYHQILGYNLILFYYKVVALFFCSSMFAKFLISVGDSVSKSVSGTGDY